MYRSVEQIVQALHSGQTTIKSIRNSISRYRKLNNLACVVMYMTAVETYLHDVKLREDHKTCN